jgi:hypothetical protein
MSRMLLNRRRSIYIAINASGFGWHLGHLHEIVLEKNCSIKHTRMQVLTAF